MQIRSEFVSGNCVFSQPVCKEVLAIVVGRDGGGVVLTSPLISIVASIRVARPAELRVC